MDSSQLQVIAFVAVVSLVLLGAKLSSWWRRSRERARGRAAVKRGLRGEREAEKFLKQLGYTLLVRHTPASYGMLVDGEPQLVQLKADYLVERGGKQFVVEVKTGKSVAVEHPDTRRQLLEYQLAFGVDSLLLVDMEARQVRTVRFPLPRGSAGRAKRATMRWALAALIGLGAAWVLTQKG